MEHKRRKRHVWQPQKAVLDMLLNRARGFSHVARNLKFRKNLWTIRSRKLYLKMEINPGAIPVLPAIPHPSCDAVLAGHERAMPGQDFRLYSLASAFLSSAQFSKASKDHCCEI